MGADVSTSSQNIRLRTWPLAGFLIGFLLAPPPAPEGGPRDVLIVSFMAGVVLGCLGLTAAAMFGGKRRATQTTLPFREERPGLAVAFTLSFLTSLVAKMYGFWSLMPLLIGMIPIYIVLKGGKVRKTSCPTDTQQL